MEKEFLALRKEKNLDALVITSASNLFYMTGYINADAGLIVSKQGAKYFTDKRYTLEAARSIANVEIIDVGRDLYGTMLGYLTAFRSVGFESSISYGVYKQLFGKLDAEMVEIDDDLLQQRCKKTDIELDLISRASAINDVMFKHIIGEVKEGMTENELAALVEYTMKMYGADGISFDTIVAFGKGSAEPHHRPSDCKLKYGDMITIDCGAKLKGYCSDVTRTFSFGRVDNYTKTVYNNVLEANRIGIEALVVGRPYVEVDKEVRAYLDSVGLGEYFTHGLGHGVGIDIHECPTVNSKSQAEVTCGHIVTIEPGVYLAGKFGVRIEDLLYIDENGANALTHFDKNLIEI